MNFYLYTTVGKFESNQFPLQGDPRCLITGVIVYDCIRFYSSCHVLPQAFVLLCRLVAPMRKIKAPVRFSDPVYIISACHKKLQPFEGQPRKWRLARRYPELQVHQSRIPDAGFGLFVAEDVKAGQPITTYKRKIISESDAKKLKKKVWILFYRNENTVEDNVQLSRETDIFEQIMLHVVAWIQNLPHRLI